MSVVSCVGVGVIELLKSLVDSSYAASCRVGIAVVRSTQGAETVLAEMKYKSTGVYAQNALQRSLLTRTSACAQCAVGGMRRVAVT